MNPHQKNKIDINSMTADEQRLFRLYGKLPNKKDLLQNKLKERKYFDSGDYAMSKAGKADDVTSIGTEHPSAETIPHASPLAHTISRGDSISGASPPQNSPSLSSTPSNSSNPLTGADSLGPSPAGLQRGSINGIPGGGLPGGIGSARSPAKESYLNRSESVDDQMPDVGDADSTRAELEQSVSPPRQSGGIPIRR